MKMRGGFLVPGRATAATTATRCARRLALIAGIAQADECHTRGHAVDYRPRPKEVADIHLDARGHFDFIAARPHRVAWTYLYGPGLAALRRGEDAQAADDSRSVREAVVASQPIDAIRLLVIEVAGGEQRARCVVGAHGVRPAVWERPRK